MSNTDGEDTQRRQRHNAAIRILEDEDEEYKLNCICTLLESQQELASLREQLNSQKDRCIDLFEKVSEREEVIRELILIVEFYHDERIRYTEMPYKNWNAIIEKAKSLTTKDK